MNRRSAIVALEVLVDLRHHHRSLTDSRGDPLDRAAADVADDEQTGNGGLVGLRWTRLLPQRVGRRVRSGQNVPVLVAPELWKPTGSRFGADHHEQPGHVQGLFRTGPAMPQHDVLQPAVATSADDLA